MSDVPPAVKLELRITPGAKGKSDVANYRVIGATNTTKPRLGAEMTEPELDKFLAKHRSIRCNIVQA